MMQSMKARNPRTGIEDYSFTAADDLHIKELTDAVRQNQAAWWAAGNTERARVMRAWAKAIHHDRQAIIDALTIDTGRKRISVEEVDGIVHIIEGYCDVAPGVLEKVQGASRFTQDVTFEIQYVPYPVLGVISPWNFPLILSLLDAIPALLAGCGAVIKPSEVTPRFVEPLRRTIEAVPGLSKILKYVLGGAETGTALVEHSDAIVFTGSIATGRKVAVAAARNFIPAFLELGGKDPAIVLKGADLDRAATAILRSAVYNSGQVCYAIERVFVDAALEKDLVRKLVEKASALEINYPDMSTGHIGPIIYPRQVEIIERQLADAVQKGARIECGGKILNKEGGIWVEPTVVSGITADMALMQEETFGPIIPVMAFDKPATAVELANASDYGLSGAVFGGSMTEAQSIAACIDAGGMSVNDTELPRAIMLDGEKMAFKLSGMGGSRYGSNSILRYVRKKAIITNAGPTKSLDVLDEAKS